MPSIEIYKRALSNSLRILMREKPFSKISTSEICQKAGISRRSFYRYFPDKYELLNWTYYDAFRLVPQKGWYTWDYFPIICHHLYSDREFYSNAFAVDGQNSFLTYCHERLHPYILKDFEGVFTSEKITLYFIDLFLDELFEYMRKWLMGNPDMLPDEFASFVRNSVTSFSKRLYEISNREFHTMEDG